MAASYAQKAADRWVCLAFAIEWLIVGGLPLIHPKPWWLEPDACITICSIPAAILAAIPALERVSQVPALFAGFAWYCWFGLFVWKTIRLVWRTGWWLVSRISAVRGTPGAT